MDVTFTSDAAEFLASAGPALSAEPVRLSVVATLASRTARQQAEGTWEAGDRPCWFATIGAGDDLTVAMRTHPEPPHGAFLPAMPSTHVAALRDALLDRDELVPCTYGDPDAGQALLAAMATRHGGSVRTEEHLRLFEASAVVRPPQPAGSLRVATLEDLDLVHAWVLAFLADADRQGGREPKPVQDPTLRDRVATNVADGRVCLWEVDGRPVHLTGQNVPTLGATRIGPVYTPEEHRGQGYAGWVVAEITQRLLDAGQRPCLYTDQANPVSNKVYERIGYRPVADEANLLLAR